MKKIVVPFCFLFFLATVGQRNTAWAQNGETTPQKSAENEANLIPAAMGIRSDKRGNSWNVGEDGSLGRIGSSMINSGLALSVNGQKFLSHQPLMTPDGKEFIMQGRNNSALPGLKITRRILLMEEEGGLRYLEIFFNGSANPLNLNVNLSTSFSGNYKTFVTDRGRAEAVLLMDNEGGILVVPGSSQSNKAYLFALCAAHSKNKPTISAQNRYALRFQYRLSIPPGGTRVLAHVVGQVVLPEKFDRRNLIKTFRPFSVDRISAGLSKDLQTFLSNGRNTASLSDVELMANTSIDALGVERGPRDVLAMGEKTRLIGTAECSHLKVSTTYGEAEVPFENVAAIVGRNKGLREAIRIFLRDGQVLTGSAEVSDFYFTLANGGRMKLELNNLDRLVRAREKNDSQWDESLAALVETFDGDRIRIDKGEAITLSGVTSWGELAFPVSELIWMGPSDEEPAGHFVELKNGNSCLIFPSANSLTLHSDLFGQCELDFRRIRSMITEAAGHRSSYGGISGLATFIQLPGNQQIVGELEDTHLKLISNGQVVDLSPGEIRRLTRIENASASDDIAVRPDFRVEMWDGGLVDGFVQSEFLSMKVGGRNWQIPFVDIQKLETPTPSLGADAVKKIHQLLVQLGADAWAVREKATAELGAFGYLARPVLQQEARRNPDPEVKRRIERILSETVE